MTRATIDVIGVSGVNLTVGASGSIGSAGSRYTSPLLTPALNLASGSTYTISFFLKKTTAHTIGGYYATIGGAAAGDLGGGFDVSGSFSSGSIYNSALTTNRIRRVERWGTDVFRCSETFTMTASGTIEKINLGVLTAVNSTTVAPTGTTMGFAAPQLELGSVPTSFIPTTTGTGSRSADVISVSGAVSGSIGQTEGVLYIECESNNGEDDVFNINRSAANAITVYKNANNAYLGRIYHSSTSIIFTSASGVTGTVKIAIAYKSGDSTMYLNGSRVGTLNTTAITFGAALNSLGVDKSSAFFSGIKPSRIRAVALYNTRLTDAELATLTTP
jgi:hypothetical protein